MCRKTASIVISLLVTAISGSFALAACPSADLTGDCFVDYEDFALMAAQWLTTDPCIPEDMAYIPGGTYEMGDSRNEGWAEAPVHTVTVDSFYMGKYMITNEQYCTFLNTAILAGDIKVVDGSWWWKVHGFNDTNSDYPYFDRFSGNQIDYNDVSGTFSIRTKSGRDMSDDPMFTVTWYGALAYCNWRSRREGYEWCYYLSTRDWDCDFSKKGYRLATEAEWEYAARGGVAGRRFLWGDTISHSQANYWSYWEGGSPYYPYDVSPTEGCHPAWNDGVAPFTSPVGSFSANGYGLYDMAGNVWEWCYDWYDYYDYSPTTNPTGPTIGYSRVLRGGYWAGIPEDCRVASRFFSSPGGAYGDGAGFRMVLDLN